MTIIFSLHIQLLRLPLSAPLQVITENELVNFYLYFYQILTDFSKLKIMSEVVENY